MLQALTMPLINMLKRSEPKIKLRETLTKIPVSLFYV